MKEIASFRRDENGKPKNRRYHQARWDEPIIFELDQPGERGICVPEASDTIREAAGDVLARLPAGMRRSAPPALPQISQNRVLRHYLRLSQENLGADFNVDIGQGTCTMKYNPKVNEHIARSHKVSELHPHQPAQTVQGMLDVVYRFEQIMKEVSGMDRFSFQPRAGSQAIYANAAVIRAYHEANGEGDQRDEVITTMFSHPSDAACAVVCGYKVITIMPDEDGYPDFEAFKAALSERTAGILFTNPEDTGVFNPRIREFTDAAHAVGAICAYDQANANGLLGITRTLEAGFDLCHFNLHKTFSTPHACGGPACGAQGATARLAPFLPRPQTVKTDNGYVIDDDMPQSVGKVSSFMGVLSMVVRAYAWVMNLGADGLREVAEIATLNNNYLMHEMLKLRGIEVPYTLESPRIEQVRYSWVKLFEETGVHSGELGVRLADFGLHYWTSHHPFVVPEPATIEPTEAYSRADLDEFVRALAQVVDEAYTDPEKVKTAPHACPIHKVDESSFEDPASWAVTWRGYQRKLSGGDQASGG